ncbi:MAG TPA: cation-transporting P-type ATPase [Legionella sp.]|nr:cation-transporting P-type ATPase [Legionella sp.]
MTKQILFQESFLIAGIMCHQGCGVTIQGYLQEGLHALKQEGVMPHSAVLIMDAEPHALGIHCVSVTIECDEGEDLPAEYNARIANKLKDSIDDSGFELFDDAGNMPSEISPHVNQINILVNLLAIGGILVLSAVFPPSVWLTSGLTTLSFLTTAFTARHYLVPFYHNLRNQTLYNMSTTITLGWLLSLVHTLFHAITMPAMAGFSMAFMNFIMPVVLIMAINGMDEIKRWVLRASKKMQLNGMQALFPQMATAYPCYSLSQDDVSRLLGMDDPSTRAQCLQDAQDLFDKPVVEVRKSALKKGAVIQIKRGECFPVDGMIMHGNTRVNASLLTGESTQSKCPLDFVPAGAVNLDQPVTVYAMNDAYNSTVNQLLFVANRAKRKRTGHPSPNHTFLYLYSGLIGAGIAASVLGPVVFATFTMSVVLQNVTGILFAICPCTMAIAHELPHLLSIHHRSSKGILLRDDGLVGPSDDIHTIVFDKTGTLTTGNSEVDSFEGISRALWQRVYLLEKHHGAEHPLAKAIEHAYEATATYPNIMHDIHSVAVDSNHRGLSAMVQGQSIHIGNAAFLQQSGIALPNEWPASIQHKLALGYSPVYVAENHVYQGVILVKHEVSPGVIADLLRLKREGKRLILLTGDNALSARGFNQQNGAIFETNDVHAGQTPQDKERFLKTLMRADPLHAKGVWFVGDGLNDAPCATVVSEEGGMSCAMTSDDKAAFFTDITLNGSLGYLFQHHHINRFLKKVVLQNQGLLLYGALASLVFIMTLSMVGLAVSPLIPMMVMVSTTLFVLFNAYRVNASMDIALDQKASWLKRCLAHDGSIGLLVGASALLMCGVLMSTVAMGALSFPILVFTAGATMAFSSACVLAGSALLIGFVGVGVASLWVEYGLCRDELPVTLEHEAVPLRCFDSHNGSEPRSSASNGPHFFRPLSPDIDSQVPFEGPAGISFKQNK